MSSCYSFSSELVENGEDLWQAFAENSSVLEIPDQRFWAAFPVASITYDNSELVQEWSNLSCTRAFNQGVPANTCDASSSYLCPYSDLADSSCSTKLHNLPPLSAQAFLL